MREQLDILATAARERIEGVFATVWTAGMQSIDADKIMNTAIAALTLLWWLRVWYKEFRKRKPKQPKQ